MVVLALLVTLVGLSTPALAAEVFRDTPFYSKQSGKMESVDRIPAGVEIIPLKATPDGQWLRVWWKEQEGWIRARDVSGVDPKILRVPAAQSDASDQLSTEANAFRLDLGLEARRVGVGFGAGYYRRIPALEIFPEARVDVGLLAYWFPTAVGGQVQQALLLARALRPVAGKLEVGGELGVAYTRFVADDPFGFGDNVTSTFEAAFGPVGSYLFGSQFRGLANVRVLLGENVNVMLALGIEYRL